MTSSSPPTPQPALAGLVQFVPTVERILYGAGVVESHLPAELDRLKGERVLLLTSPSVERGRHMELVRTAIGKRLAGVFATPFEHVPLERVAEATEVARRLSPDVVVAFGGGSVLDAAKAVRTCLAAGLTAPNELGAFMEKPSPPQGSFVPQVSIPTTLSGSEYSRSFSATDFTQHVKRAFTHSGVASRVIFYDPALTLGTPEPLWMASGVMAIAHSVEVLCAYPPHLVGDVLKFASLRELLAHLPRIRLQPGDLDARLRCQIAAWMADHSPLRSQPLSASPVALPVHALAYDMGALYRVSYSHVACVILPATLRWAAARQTESRARQATLAREAGLVPPDAPDNDAAQVLAQRLQGFIGLLLLPTRLRDLGLSRKDAGPIARSFAARGGRLLPTAPASENDVARLLEEAW
ncbi:MAG: iron-containing alcohol dehydrogenase [Dehalococcoidia bacterium]|nr:iron-containing alcohol dehydrogenase [Dehalococcoidia bacterium]